MHSTLERAKIFIEQAGSLLAQIKYLTVSKEIIERREGDMIGCGMQLFDPKGIMSSNPQSVIVKAEPFFEKEHP